MTFRSQDLKFLVDTYGKVITLTAKSQSAYDPSTGGVTSTSESYDIKAYFYNYNLGDINGQNILMGDRRVVISLRDVFGSIIPEPDVGDELSGEGDKVSIVSVAKIMSGFDPVCYICQVRE